eukprot:gnl/MRDRNA2_/MRDRNA2_54539_c0_seq1.p1 gnl/MRDRNA2_/MRDRNA2_54539_c0~~gnl/MRDRNA2_/MRDRNA2_54539_c0_seq1.p1  ORF type:complete len:282 (-),score=39.31 gnl/MRDRNA2_/MRDRNA2_54539_c0_seq1:98-943(-)
MRIGFNRFRYRCSGFGTAGSVISLCHLHCCDEQKRNSASTFFTSCEGAQYDYSDPNVAAQLESTYRNPEVVAQRKRTLEVLAIKPGERVLDVGCGPAFLVAELAAAVGPQGHAEGVDPSQAMVVLGQRKLGETRNATLRVGGAESLPFPDSIFDAVIFTQVMCYVQDVPNALQEAKRVLVPGGRLLVLDTDWRGLIINAPDEARARRVIESQEKYLIDAVLPRKLPRLLQEAGFQMGNVQAFTMIAAGTVDQEASWVGQLIFQYLPQGARAHSPGNRVLHD